jgi:hypothetical protein
LASGKIDYPEISGIAQAMKYQIRTGSAWKDLNSSTKESLDQILTSIARIVCGEGMHWDGIINYAQAAKPHTDDPNAVPPPSTPGSRAGKLFDPAPNLERDVLGLVRQIPRRDDDA